MLEVRAICAFVLLFVFELHAEVEEEAILIFTPELEALFMPDSIAIAENECPENEEHVFCKKNCTTCANRYCTIPNCEKGCDCKRNHYRTEQNGTCVHASKCPQMECDENEVFLNCGPMCEYCGSYRCLSIECTYRCFCKPGFLRNGNATCVPQEECPKPDSCPPHEVMMEFGSSDEYCSDTPKNETINKEKCYCIPNHRKSRDGFCIKEDECPSLQCDIKERHYDCIPQCNTTCENYANDDCVEDDEACYESCFCADGLVMNNHGFCVKYEECILEENQSSVFEIITRAFRVHFTETYEQRSNMSDAERAEEDESLREQNENEEPDVSVVEVETEDDDSMDHDIDIEEVIDISDGSVTEEDGGNDEDDVIIDDEMHQENKSEEHMNKQSDMEIIDVVHESNQKNEKMVNDHDGLNLEIKHHDDVEHEVDEGNVHIEKLHQDDVEHEVDEGNDHIEKLHQDDVEHEVDEGNDHTEKLHQDVDSHLEKDHKAFGNREINDEDDQDETKDKLHQEDVRQGVDGLLENDHQDLVVIADDVKPDGHDDHGNGKHEDEKDVEGHLKNDHQDLTDGDKHDDVEHEVDQADDVEHEVDQADDVVHEVDQDDDVEHEVDHDDDDVEHDQDDDRLGKLHKYDDQIENLHQDTYGHILKNDHKDLDNDEIAVAAAEAENFRSIINNNGNVAEGENKNDNFDLGKHDEGNTDDAISHIITNDNGDEDSAVIAHNTNDEQIHFSEEKEVTVSKMDEVVVQKQEHLQDKIVEEENDEISNTKNSDKGVEVSVVSGAKVENEKSNVVTVTCPETEEPSACIDFCNKCNKSKNCDFGECKEGCDCKDGFTRNDSNECVPKSECTQNDEGVNIN